MGARRWAAAATLVTVGAVTVAGCGTAGTGQTETDATRPVAVTAPVSVPVSAPVRMEPTRVIPVAATTGTGVRTAAAGFAPFTAPGRTLKPGSRGTEVKALQARLKELGYVPGPLDGQYGGTTQMAVWAFQKVQGITPTSTVASRTWRALENPKAPKVLVPRGKPDRVEVNLAKQIMVLYSGGEVKLISHVSSGSGIPYTEYAMWNGKRTKFTGSARTPTGDYKTTWRRSGWHRSYLGQLYNPIFFNGGIALHGALSVPLYPASHGCVRLPMKVAEILPGMLGTGVPVHVRGKFVR
ncbi:L,D-transpeptidase family protein [Microtetraspora malaysiensis]|uniref:L,D-transpeptidase family protein n=1 Tax=Microtetraspora malaysiensis TaxID=161358 RepID=UPI000A00C0D6|nr:L,D-transpeptidase family protein [Microtetraspora malaysiensis]